jgi:hypothetical protein
MIGGTIRYNKEEGTPFWCPRSRIFWGKIVWK